MSKKDTVEVYKILFTPQNQNLILRANDLYFSQEELTKSFKLLLNIATTKATMKEIKAMSATTLRDQVIYLGVANNKIISTFTHLYDSVSKEIYLNESFTHESVRGQGYGTKIYKKIIEDIFLDPEIIDICATADTISGTKFLEKLGFMPNTRPDSYGGNSILYSPHKVVKPFKIRLEKLHEICPLRFINKAPNIDKFNDEMKALIARGGYDENITTEKFKTSLLNYCKKKTNQTLKSLTPVTKVSDQGEKLINKKFSISKNDLTDDYDPNETELEANLTKLRNLQNLDSSEKK